MQAPLGRAVIGGLVMSTFATLLVLPSIFAMVVGTEGGQSSPSIYPDDPESKHYDPRVFLNEENPAEHHGVGHNGDAEHHNGLAVAAQHETVPQNQEEVLVFLKRILDEAKSRRSDMTTHYTTDDLLVALGFAKPGRDRPDEHPTLASALAIALGSEPAAKANEPAKTAPETPDIRTESPDELSNSTDCPEIVHDR